MNLKKMVFGDVCFADGEEYFQFQYRFACAILICSTFISGLFWLTETMEVSQFDQHYLIANRFFFVSGIILFFALRNNPQRMRLVAGIYECESLILYVIVFFLNPVDELRIIWFGLNLPAVYLILGRRFGVAVTILSMIFVIMGNPYLAEPYSVNAMVTIIIGMTYLSIFFHTFASQSISFHHAMVDANLRLSEMASRDPLTGLFNARAYYSFCERALRQAQRVNAPVAVLFIDLDHFKSINDKHGHEAGDTVLKSVANCMMQAIRQSDIAGRIGGEEFSVLLPDTDLAGAGQLAEKLRQSIELLQPDIGVIRLTVTASIGVACGQPDRQTLADLQRHADQAMYLAKRQGRNRVTCLDNIPVADQPAPDQPAVGQT